MAKLLPKHELFCQEYVKDQRGDLAYTRSYGQTKNPAAAASRLLARTDIKARIAQLQDALAERNEVTVDSLMQDLERIYQIGIDLGDKGDTKGLSPAATAKHTQAKLAGLMVDKVQHSTESMSDAELVKAIQGEQTGTVIPWADVLKVSKGRAS